MSDKTFCKAYVEPCEDDELLAEGYRFTVYIYDAEDETDLLDIQDFKTEQEALDVEKQINEEV